MQKASQRQKNRGNWLLWAAGILLCLTAVSTCLLSRLAARYSVGASGSDEARIAAWDVTAQISREKADINADGEYKEYYTFTVTPGNTEVAWKYGAVVTLTDPKGVPAWPAGVTARLTDADGVPIVATNTDGVFADLGTFAPGETDGVSYRLYFKAPETVMSGTYTVDIAVTAEQMD